LGEKTRDILFDLAVFGSGFPPETDVVRPGNLRTVAVTLGTACRRAVTGDYDFEASIIVDGEAFALSARNGAATMLYQPAANPDVVLETSYDALLSVAEGEIGLEDFAARNCRVEVNRPGKEVELFGLLSAALEILRT
jgi:hypothetical protein